jgi:uncharacterized protein YcbK (DUF882 family)
MSTLINRRNFISLLCGATAYPGAACAVPRIRVPRRLQLFNAHTGETFSGFYRNKDGPLSSAVVELSLFLRDFHSGTTVEMDIGVIDFLSDVMDATDVDNATILSAYRSPETNAMLARTVFGVAEHSQHMYGRALDVYFGDRLTDAVVAARRMQLGGVGWYPYCGFMHIDTGPVRNWDLNERGLASLLTYRNRGQINNRPELISGSGHLKLGMEQSGHLLPGLERSGQMLQPGPVLTR